MKLVYIAGPYRAPTAWGIEQNIHRARYWGIQVAKLGAVPLIPHANTAHFDGEAPDEFWLEGTLEMMRRCDAVVLIPGWQLSKGAVAEREEAIRLGIPVHEIEAGDWATLKLDVFLQSVGQRF